MDTLLYCLGDEADSVLASMNVSAEDRKKYQEVIGKLDSYFRVRRNVIFERARFNRRSQKEGETAEQYITELYTLIEFCEYGNLKEELLRDRLVVGIRDVSLSEKLQTDPDLTLERAKRLIRQKEAAREHRRELHEDKKEVPLCKVVTNRRFQNRTPAGRVKPQYKGAASGVKIKQTECSKCGKARHQARERCPAMGAECHNCHKKGHFSVKCYSKKTAVAAVESDPMEEVFLGTLTADTNQHSWVVDLQVKGHTISFKLDTGAEVTAITEDSYKAIGRPKLTDPFRILCGPARQRLDVVGQFEARLTKGERSTSGPVYVVKGLRSNLLGFQMLTALQLVQ